jgi:hypothetical protein
MTTEAGSARNVHARPASLMGRYCARLLRNPAVDIDAEEATYL